MPRSAVDHVAAKDVILSLISRNGPMSSRGLRGRRDVRALGFTDPKSIGQFIRYNMQDVLVQERNGTYRLRHGKPVIEVLPADYTAVTPGCTVYTIEVVLDHECASDGSVDDIVNHARTYGAAELMGQREVAESFERASEILRRRALKR